MRLWRRILQEKYFPWETIIEWIINSNKATHNGSTIWKSLLNSFPIIGNWLIWKVGIGSKVFIGRDPWIGSSNQHLLLENIILVLNHQGFYYLNHIWQGQWLNHQEVGISPYHA